MAWRLLIALILALCLVPIGSSPVVALSVDDYFEITYEVSLSKTEINGSEVFYATITATATRNNNDFPLSLSPSEALITGRIIAEYQATDAKVTLNSSYTVEISPFPQKGETAQESEVVSLQFPGESKSGTYSVVGELIKAEVTVLGIAIPATEHLPSSQIMGSVTYVAPSGGGGFGPALTLTGEEVKTNLFGIEASFPISSSGEILETIEAASEDGALTLTVHEGIIALLEGEPLETLEAAVEPSPPEPPEDTRIIGVAYDFGPEGVTFDPPITLTWSYDPNDIPGGVAEEDLVLAWYDEAADRWVELDCVANTENNTITASIEHFTTFAIIGMVTPTPESELEVPIAVFHISELDISPSEVDIGQMVTISVLVINSGNLEDTYQVALEIDNKVAATEEVTVSAGFSKEVTFTISKDIAGTYSVDVNGLTDSFTVKEKETAVIPTPSSDEETSLSPSAEETSPPPLAKEISWPVAYSVVAVLVAMGSLLFFLVRRSHTKSSS